MSDLSPTTLQKWRDQGSLRYLAHHLGVTAKQVTRYWEYVQIDGAYRTSKGHRRIRYSDDTVERVALAVKCSKATNIAIRYHIPPFEYCGTVIPVKGCTSRQDVYRRARKAGLDERDAWNAANGLLRSGAPPYRYLASELLQMGKGISEKEVDDCMSLYRRVPLRYLGEARDAKDFRARARVVWRKILSELKAKAGWDSSQEGEARRQEIRNKIRPLLLQPDRDAFFLAYEKGTEVESRIMEYKDDEQTYRKVEAWAVTEPEIVSLRIAVRSLQHSEQNPTAAALAEALEISRPALYRRYKGPKIQEVLNELRNDPMAASATRTDRKKSKLLGTKRGE
jgi:hypothetical protein